MWTFKGGAGRLFRAATQWARGTPRSVADFSPWSARWGTATDERRRDNGNPPALETPQPSRLLLQTGDLFLRQSGYKLLLQDQAYDPGAFVGSAISGGDPAADDGGVDDAAAWEFAGGLAVQDAAAPADDRIAGWTDDGAAVEAADELAAFDFAASAIGEDAAVAAEMPPPALLWAPANDFSTGSGQTDDEAAFDWTATSAADEHDVPTSALADDPAEGDEDDPAPWDYVATLAVADIAAAADMPLAMATNDDVFAAGDVDDAPFDWSAMTVAANDDAPPDPGGVAEWYIRVRRRR